MSKAILVSYNIHRPAFIIEGFKDDKVDIDILGQKILSFFEKICGKNNVEVEEVLNDFIVTTKQDVFTVKWSWYTSIKYK